MAGLSEKTQGVALSFLTNTTWGLLPFYLYTLSVFSSFTILGFRILLASMVAVIFIYFSKYRSEFINIFKSPKSIAWLSLTAFFIATNWFLFIYANSNGRILDASLGYFMMPLASAFFGKLFFGDYFSPIQLCALGLALFASLLMAVYDGVIPYLGFGLALSFSSYGLVRKKLGFSSLAGFTAESILLVPVGIAILFWMPHPEGALTFDYFMVCLIGPITVMTLVSYAGAIKRLPLSYAGILFYWNPLLQMVSGLILGENFSKGRMVGFGLIWVALFLFNIKSFRRSKI